VLISALIREQFGLKYMDDELAVLDRLAGKKIGLNIFDKDINKWMSGWNGQTAAYLLTRYFFPIAERAEITVGLHLLPSYVARGRCAVAQFDPESDRLMDHAYSLRAYIHRELLEADVEGDDIDEDLKIAREVFGKDFYQALPDQVPYDDVERAMIDKYGGAAVDYKDLAWMAKGASCQSSDAQIEWLKRGAEAVPECMDFHRELARLYAAQGRSKAAALCFARSLACHHHTAYGWRPERYYALGRELLDRVPPAFSNTARRDLTLTDGEVRMRWLISLFQQGDVETSLKLLSDFRYDSGTDLHPILFAFLRRHYEALRWSWALAWCDLCALDEDHESVSYSYRGQSLPPNWDQPVRSRLGLP
jgi:hypothetical protein